MMVEVSKSIVNMIGGNSRALAVMLATAFLVVVMAALAGWLFWRAAGQRERHVSGRREGNVSGQQKRHVSGRRERNVSGQRERHLSGQRKGLVSGRGGFLSGLMHVFLVIPPTALELAVLFLLCRGGSFVMKGEDAVLVHEPALWAAALLVAVVEVTPVFYWSMARAGEKVRPSILTAARTIGMPEGRILRQIVLPQTLQTMVRGLISGFARALGSYGIMMILSERISVLQADGQVTLGQVIFSGSYVVAWIWAILWLCFAGLFWWWTGKS